MAWSSSARSCGIEFGIGLAADGRDEHAPSSQHLLGNLQADETPERLRRQLTDERRPCAVLVAGLKQVVHPDLGVHELAAGHQAAGAPSQLVDQAAPARTAEDAVQSVAGHAQQLRDPVGARQRLLLDVTDQPARPPRAWRWRQPARGRRPAPRRSGGRRAGHQQPRRSACSSRERRPDRAGRRTAASRSRRPRRQIGHAA